MAPTTSSHRWQFHRVGGLDQVSLSGADDLRHLHQLDQKLWVALSCPVTGLELDQRTLEFLDTDKDGRVRVPELLAAIAFCDARLADLGLLLDGKESLPLAALDASRPEGRALLGGARRILASLGRGEAAEVTPDDVKDLTHVFEKVEFDGDGVVGPEQAGGDVEARQLILDAMACAGQRVGRNGKPGVDRKVLESFFSDLAAHDAWLTGCARTGAMVYGDVTSAAFDAVTAIRPKVDDYFARCRLAAMDPRGAAAVNRTVEEWAALAAHPLGPAGEAAAFPLARAEAGRPLPLSGAVNPAWAGALAALRDTAVKAAFGPGREQLTEGDWTSLLAALAAFQAQVAGKAGATVEKLGPARVRQLVAGAGRAAVERLIEEDERNKDEAAAVEDVARLVHYHRDLRLLLHNFVNFADFYDPKRKAIFQAGTLYLDGRSCDLCVRVADPAAHAAHAIGSRMFVAYCDLKRSTGETMKIAACFTAGDRDFLTVGRNGLFYDRKGRDWDATITRVVDNAISIRQAFFSPYKKFVRMVEEQANKFAAAKEKEADTHLAKAAALPVGGQATLAPAAPAAAPAPVDVGRMVGIIAALGVGAGAIATILGGLVAGFMGLQPWWAKLAALGGLVLAISGPSMLLAWLNLRQRTLGPLLDATGWAINGRIRINLPLGATLTDVAVLPPGARRSLEDPFVDQQARTRRRVAVLLVLAVLALLALARYHHAWPFGPWPF